MGYTGSNPTTIFSNIYRTDNLPPTTVNKKTKESKKWKIAMMDAFEHEGIKQFNDNLQFIDLYRMVEGKLTYQELSEVAPHMEGMQDLLDGVGIPSFLRHYDIIGIVINALVGHYEAMQPKFHVADTGEIAENDFIRHQNKQLQDILLNVIKNSVDMSLAEAGFSDTKEFATPEEQQAYIQQLNAARESFVPKDTERASKQKFKTLGVQWGENTLERDNQRFDFVKLERKELKDKLTSGRCFRHYRIGYDEYEPETWSPKNTFFSREIDAEMVHKGEYIGRVMFYTPAQVIRRYGHEIDAKMQKKLLGGNDSWKSFVGDGYYSGSIENAIESNFNKQATVPFANYHDYNFMLGLQEETGIPMGIQTVYNDDGTTSTNERFLPRLRGDNHGRYTDFARILRDDYRQRLDLCQVTECYFRAYELWGYLTYETESGLIRTEEVTEDILPQFLKDNNIKQTYTESLVEVVKEFKPNTLQWTYRPVIFEGLKIQSENLTGPLYPYCRPCEHQIKGDSEFDRWLPVAGYIGKSEAKKIEPYQAKYNLCMNQIYSLLEKEIGIFFLLDTAMIPSEYNKWGNAEDAMVAIRNIAKDIGILPISSGQSGLGNQSNFNQFSTYNLSYSSQINDRVQLAEFSQRKAYEVIGINPNMLQAPTKYETAEGIKQNQEATYAQVSEIYEDFEQYVKVARELHLSVAQYCQSNKKDITIHYTKGDGSIEFLRFNDPKFPLRNIGLIPSVDGRKRKELEQFKMYLLNNNTIGSDTLELAKLIGSDDMSEAVEIARIAQEKKAKQDQVAHERQQELLQQKAASDSQLAEDNWNREEESKQRDREVDINREWIKALGRASDKDSDLTGITEINKAAEQAQRENELNFKIEEANREFTLKEKKEETDKQLKFEQLKLKAKELEERAKDRKSKEFIATINKN